MITVEIRDHLKSISSSKLIRSVVILFFLFSFLQPALSLLGHDPMCRLFVFGIILQDISIFV